MKKILLSLFGLLLLFPVLSSAQHSSQEDCSDYVNVYFFTREGCKHCEDEKVFLDEFVYTKDTVHVFEYDISEASNRKLFNELTDRLGIPKVTPVTIIEKSVIQGFDRAETSGERILKIIKDYEEAGDTEIGDVKEAIVFCELAAEEIGTCGDPTEPCELDTGSIFSLPAIFGGGQINVSKYSLPVLSLVLGLIDGFNPCAMWVLVMFLILLVDSGSLKRMLQLAGLFIVAEAIMYYLILNVWYSAWDFIGLNEYITPLVGILAVGAGLYFLYEGLKGDGTCKVAGMETRTKTRDKLKKMVESPLTWLSIIGIIGIAFSVNIFEFVCSIGIPQAFTKILEINELGFFGYQGYMSLYILAYMIDDLIVFGIALYSFEKIGLTGKYTKISHLVGGVLMLILGLLFLFNPQMLVV